MTALLDPILAPVAPVAPVAGAAVERAGSALEDVTASALWSVSDAELADLVVEAGQLAARAQGLLLRLVGEADAREALTGPGAASSAAFLRSKTDSSILLSEVDEDGGGCRWPSSRTSSGCSVAGTRRFTTASLAGRWR